MTKANPKAWFASSAVAKISYRPVDRRARLQERIHPFFATWKEAHDWMLARASERLTRAARELASARRSLDKIKAMKEPEPDEVEK